MPWYKIVARLSHATFRFLKNLTNFLDALFSGVWLGVMGKRSLEYSDELYYNHSSSYSDIKYNESGFFNWEKPVIKKYFSNLKTVLLIAAGGGREVIALTKMGLEVDAYECNPRLIEFGNSLLKKNNINSRIKPITRNSMPSEIKTYDGIIIGWGAYSLIQGSKKRIKFLDAIHPFMEKGSPLLISFIYSVRRTRKDAIIKTVANFFRTVCRRDRTETGDRLVPNFIHYFSKDEIKTELQQANFKIIEYSEGDYGYVIATI